MTFENYIKARLVDFALNEARNDGSIDCQLAAAQIIANRVHAGWEGGSWLKVIDSAAEFAGTIYENRITADPRSMAFRELLRRIEEVYHGTGENVISVTSFDGDEIRHPLYYCEGHNVNRAWFKDNILSDPDAHPYMGKAGPFIFFG